MLRAAAQILAPARNAHVLTKTLAGLCEISADKTDLVFRSLRTALQKEGERCVPGKVELTKIETSLRAVLGRVEDWPLAKLGHRKVQEALERSFRRCQKAFCQSLKTSDSSSFHAWRKRVKDLEYHLCLFEMAWRKKAARAWKQIKRLDDYLGEDHDLALLSEKLRRFKLESSELRDGSRKIAEQISKRRLNLQRCATKAARKLLRQRPAFFVSRNLDL